LVDVGGNFGPTKAMIDEMKMSLYNVLDVFQILFMHPISNPYKVYIRGNLYPESTNKYTSLKTIN
jgi:hypothetical protein